jgi:peptidoglycan L-alanyl-D-glutamate endopeptidase CwlK
MLNSRSIDDLIPDARAWFFRFAAQALVAGYEQGTDWTVISTRRDQECQDFLYEQGRTRPGLIVTWTHESRHIGGKAWDIAIKENGEIVWESPIYGKLAEIGKAIGLNCGYFWPKKKQDPGHYQLPDFLQ